MMSGHGKQSNAYARDSAPSHAPGVCVHCERWTKRTYGRGLCWQCRQRPDIVQRYPTLPSSRRPNQRTSPLPGAEIELMADEGPDRPRLPVLRTYPGCRALLRCEHGLLDGVCPQCERAQRAGMTTATMEGDSDDSF